MSSHDPLTASDTEASAQSRARIIGLTDAAVAISLTLLSLELIPDIEESVTGNDLWHALGDMAPRLIAYLLSFGVVGRFWDYHRGFFRFIRVADHRVVWLSLAFLLFVSLIPATAALLGTHWEEPAAMTVYAANLILLSASLWALWRYVTVVGFVERDGLNSSATDYVDRYMAASIIGYLLAVAASLVWPPLALLLVVLMTTFARAACRKLLTVNGNQPPDP